MVSLLMQNIQAASTVLYLIRGFRFYWQMTPEPGRPS